MVQTLLWIILGILIFDFVLESTLNYLNASHLSEKLPDKLRGIYDEEKYKRSQKYFKVNQKFDFLTSTLSFLVLLAMIYFGGFAFIDKIARSFTDNPILVALIFFGILGLASDILTTPFQLYSTFVIEDRFGFNKTTPKTFILDKLKGWLLGAVIGGGLLSLIIWLYHSTGDWFWILAFIVLVSFSGLMTMFYASVILPLFNKLTPLEEGELRQQIEKLADRVGFDLKDIYVMDGSKRSSKANAFFSGLGSKKKIVLFDTLISDHTTDELVAILAHEIGHYKKKHTRINFGLAIIQTAIMLSVLSIFLDQDTQWPRYLANALGAKEAGFHLGILAFGILYTPLSMILGIAMNVVSRHFEYSADRFAVQNYGASPLQEALKRLSVKHLSNLSPHPAYVFVYYSHPPLLNRLEAMETAENPENRFRAK